MRFGQIRNNPGSQAQPAKRVNHRIADWFGTRIPVRTATRTSHHLCRRDCLTGPRAPRGIILQRMGASGMTPSIESFAALVPCDLLDRSGEVFYSGRAAFSTPSDVYLLGYNPGSDPSDQRLRTVRSSIDEVSGKPERFSPLLRSLGGGTRSEDAAGNPAHVRPHRARPVPHPFQQLCLCPIQGRE